MGFNLSSSVKITVGAATVAGTSDVQSPVIDTKGFDSVLFVSTFATPAAGNWIQANQDTVVGMGTAADLLGSKATPSGASDETAWLEIVRPSKRFVRATFKRGTSSVLGEIYCIQSLAAAEPQTNTLAGTSIGKLLVSPAEGTA